MRAQQQPTHQAPFLIPMRTGPDHPSRHDPRSRLSGLRHLLRQMFFNGVCSYTAANRSVTPVSAATTAIQTVKDRG